MTTKGLKLCNSVMSKATIYVDGACSRNGSSCAQAGIGVFWPNQEANNISEPVADGRPHTNQRAEILAASRGISQARDKGYDEVTVKLDSHYVKNAAESWIPKWEQTNWSKEVVNKNEFKELRKSMEGIKVNMEYVPSKLNQADRLARDGAKRGH